MEGIRDAHTMGAVVLDNTAHTHGRSALKQSFGDDCVGSRDGFATPGNSEDAVVHALNNLAHTGLDASLVAQVCDILATLANNDTSFLGGDNGSEGQVGDGVFLVGLGRGLAVWAETSVVVNLEVADSLIELSFAIRRHVLGRGHGEVVGRWTGRWVGREEGVCEKVGEAEEGGEGVAKLLKVAVNSSTFQRCCRSRGGWSSGCRWGEDEVGRVREQKVW